MKKVVFLLKNALSRPASIKQYREQKKNQALSKSELEQLQVEKLYRLLLHAKVNSPYYARKFNSLSLDKTKGLSILNTISPLERSDIVKNQSEIFAEKNFKRHGAKVTTGGSTGAPLEVFHDKRFRPDVLGWRVLEWWGVDKSNNIAFIYRIKRGGIKAFLNRLIWFPTRRIFLDSSMITEESMSQFSTKLSKLKPPILQGYVGGVIEFANYCKKQSLRFDFLKAVWVTSAPISKSDRLLLGEVFNAPIYDQYGCCEVHWLAAECKENNGIHIMADSRIIEILDESNVQVLDDQYGEIAVTDLENFVFPMIRYKIGDRGRFLSGECPCGVTFPRLDAVKGRISDVVRLPNGQLISGEFLTTIFDDAPEAVQAFQLHQQQDYSIDLICIPGESADATTICQQKVKDLIKLSKNTVPIRLRYVNQIQHDRGKTRFIISDVNRSW